MTDTADPYHMRTDYPATLSTKEVAQILGYSQSEVKRLCQQHKLPLMPRTEGCRYRIVTARLFRQLGIIP